MIGYVIVAYLIIGFTCSTYIEARYKANKIDFDPALTRVFLPILWLPSAVIAVLNVISMKAWRNYSNITDYMAKKLIEKKKK